MHKYLSEDISIGGGGNLEIGRIILTFFQLGGAMAPLAPPLDPALQLGQK